MYLGEGKRYFNSHYTEQSTKFTSWQLRCSGVRRQYRYNFKADFTELWLLGPFLIVFGRKMPFRTVTVNWNLMRAFRCLMIPLYVNL